MVDPRRLLGIDHGSTVIGVAICDASGLIARPLRLISRTTRAADFAALAKLIHEYQVGGLVVGLPITEARFQATSQAPIVERWAARLAASIDLPVYFWDETLSSDSAHQLADQIGRDPDARIDDLAAAIVLQSFLDNHPPGTPYPPVVAPGRHATPLPPSI